MLYHVHVEQKIEREQVAKLLRCRKDDSSVRKRFRRKRSKVYRMIRVLAEAVEV